VALAVLARVSIWHKAAERTCTAECPLLGSLRKRLDARHL